MFSTLVAVIETIAALVFLAISALAFTFVFWAPPLALFLLWRIYRNSRHGKAPAFTHTPKSASSGHSQPWR